MIGRSFRGDVVPYFEADSMMLAHPIGEARSGVRHVTRAIAKGKRITSGDEWNEAVGSG